MIGQPVRRQEDARLLTGGGRYLADIQPPGVKHAAVLRSHVAHARIVSIDVSAARELPGVVAVFTLEDLKDHVSPLSHRLEVPGVQPLEWYPLAEGKVRYVGEPVAIVIADSRYVAEDGAELIDVEYDELRAITDVYQGLGIDDAAPEAVLFDDWEDGNVFLRTAFVDGSYADAEAKADGVLTDTISHHRVIGLPLEGHGACGEFNHQTGELLLYSSQQQPHNLRTVVADALGMRHNKVRVIAPDMGGGFGNKQHFHREELLIATVATMVPYPVTWSADRTESLTAMVQSRQQEHEVEIAYSNDGRVLGVRIHLLADLGSPTLYFSSIGPALITASLLPGSYDIPAFEYQITGVATNKPPIGAYRGFGQPQANFTIERVMEIVADHLDMDPAEVRRINMIPDGPRPFYSSTGNRYDIASIRDQLDDLLRVFDYEKKLETQQLARSEGRLIGIGMASMVECTTANLFGFCSQFGGYEMAAMVVNPDGSVTASCGTKDSGQGHRTTYAQIAASVLTVDMETIRISDGDSAMLPYGMGTWGGRSTTAGGGAIMKAARQIRKKMVAIAAHLLQTDPGAIELVDGRFVGPAGEVSFQDVAGAAYLRTFLLPQEMDPGLATVASWDPKLAEPFPNAVGKMNAGNTFSSAAAAAVVEIDAGTGQTHIREFRIMHDCGTVVNPLLLDGQVQGGFAQALGLATLEEAVYDEAGQPLASTLLDYLTPSFGDIPRITTHHRETPSELEGGFRGAAEGALICGPTVLANAVADALKPLGIKVSNPNISAKALRALMREAGVKVDPFAPEPLRSRGPG